MSPSRLSSRLSLAVIAAALSLPGLFIPALAQVAGGLDLAAERSRLATEREQVLRTRSQQEAECQSRFAVTGCVEEARKRVQAPLAEIDRQERVLNDLERRQRSGAQLQRLERREAEAREDAAERRARAASDQQSRESRAAAKAGGPKPTGSPRASQAASPPAAPAGPTPGEAAANAAAHADRVRQAEEHKASVRQRQAERKKPAASDLPPVR